jgi:uridine phosphorylase
MHLRPTAELAERVLLPGDPHRALAVAQALLERPPKMFNHARGLWGYSGLARDGRPLTIQSTGMGGPSAAIVCEELIGLGARRLIRIGSCQAVAESLPLGGLVATETVLAMDGTSRALGADGPLAPDPELHEGLVEAGATPARIASTDLLGTASPSPAAQGAQALDMETAAILRAASRHGVAAAAVLGISRRAGANGSGHLGPEDLDQLGLALGEAGYAAFTGRRAST